MCYLKPLWTCVLSGKLQVNWTSPQMILAGLGRGGGASSSVVPYSSCRPSSCLASLSHWMNRTWMVEGRASRPCCLLPSPWSTRAQNPKGPFMASIWTVDSRFVSISEVRLNKWEDEEIWHHTTSLMLKSCLSSCPAAFYISSLFF